MYGFCFGRTSPLPFTFGALGRGGPLVSNPLRNYVHLAFERSYGCCLVIFHVKHRQKLGDDEYIFDLLR